MKYVEFEQVGDNILIGFIITVENQLRFLYKLINSDIIIKSMVIHRRGGNLEGITSNLMDTIDAMLCSNDYTLLKNILNEPLKISSIKQYFEYLGYNIPAGLRQLELRISFKKCNYENSMYELLHIRGEDPFITTDLKEILTKLKAGK